MNEAPQLITIADGDYEATVSTFGGGLSGARFQGAPLLVGYAEGDKPPLSSGVILAPWPNRVAEGTFSHAGKEYRLELNEPGRANAIHGFVGEVAWQLLRREANEVTVEAEAGARPGWPWSLTLQLTWSVTAGRGVRLDGAVTNSSAESCPFGLGWHPYLSALGAPLDDCELELAVATNLPLDSVRNLPSGPDIPPRAVLPSVDRAVVLEGLWLDHCFGRGASQQSGVDLSVTDAEPWLARLLNGTGRGVEIWADTGFRWAQVFTADPARREGYPGVGRAIAVEPMTCPPNALRSGRDLWILQPGETRDFSLGLRAVG